jgi:peptidoglycan/xylan/chitin deacetylase (PgdA/CDA1 family)
MSDNSIKYSFSDFTHEHYQTLLTEAKKYYQFIGYNSIEIHNENPVILCRHDVDLSMHEALNLARIENELNIKATYFLLPHSEFYNLLEKSITELVSEIISLGHDIGLHFDPMYYNISSKEELEYWLQFEKEMIEKIFGVQVNVFSFHNPTEEILRFDEWSYSGMLNTYANELKTNVAYCSDSNGYWRFKRMYDVISSEKPTKLQILTHPEWWTAKLMSPKQKIWRSIEKRAEKNKEFYENALSAYGRNIIDW